MKMNGNEYLNGTDPPTTTDLPASTHIATQAGVSWDERLKRLEPLLGHEGVTAIYLRALQCTETEHPWLHEIRERTLESDPFALLIARLSICNPGTAKAAQASVLRHFDRQLTVLVGEPLAKRLMAMSRATEEDTDIPPAPRHDEITSQLTLSALRAEDDARHARRQRDRALRASELDDLTGAATRSRMRDRLNSAIALADRTGTPTAVLFIDLDHFKEINDAMGHGVGDIMLREVAVRLRQTVRKTDTVCRYGGDEFVVILTPMERSTEAAPAAARMLAAIGKVQGRLTGLPRLTASIGIGVYPEHGTTADTLLSRADRSMYRHKHEQRDPLLPVAHEGSTRARPDVASRPANDVPLACGAFASPPTGSDFE